MINETYIHNWVSDELDSAQKNYKYSLSRNNLVEESNGSSDVTPFSHQLDIDLKKASKSHHFKAPGKLDFGYIVRSNDIYHISNTHNNYLIIIETKKPNGKQRILDTHTGKLNFTERGTKQGAENGAIWYAKCIQKAQRKNNTRDFVRIFAIGISGDYDNQTIQPYYVDLKGNVIKANPKLPQVRDLSAFTPEYIDEYYRVGVIHSEPHNKRRFKNISTFIKILHNDIRDYTDLRNIYKAPLIAGILLALYSGNMGPSDLKSRDNEDTSDGHVIYQAIASFLDKKEVQSKGHFLQTEERKLLASFKFIETNPSLYRPSHQLNYHSPLYLFVLELRQVQQRLRHNKDIDQLGNFYDHFVKYGDKDGTDLGIVLTPHHITKLMAHLINIHFHDHVLDPVAGTTSFLIASMALMFKKLDKDPNISPQGIRADRENIMKNALYGIERDITIYSVGLSNMILRGDGNSHIANDNFFDIPTSYGSSHNINKILMNPPYSQGKKGDKGEPEIDFIKHAVRILENNRLHGNKKDWELAAIVPISTVVSGASASKTKFLNWKKWIYNHCEIRAVITMNPETFYPEVEAPTVIIILKSNLDGNANNKTLLINYTNDGRGVVSRHGFQIINKNKAISQKNKLLDLVTKPNNTSIKNGKFVQRVQLTKDNDWLFNAHYTNPNPPKELDFKETIANYLTFRNNMKLHGRDYLFNNKKDK